MDEINVADRKFELPLGRKFKVYECIFQLTGPLGGELDEWPAKIQDAVHRAVERLQLTSLFPIRIVKSGVDHDERGYYAKVIAQQFPADIPPDLLRRAN